MARPLLPECAKIAQQWHGLPIVELRGVHWDDLQAPQANLELKKTSEISGTWRRKMQLISLGTKGCCELVVGSQHLANQFKDMILPPIFATPMMILIMENAALNAVRAFLDADETALGTKIDVHHIAATPIGHRVHAEAEVVRVEGNHIEFRVAAWDEDEEIGRGTHERMVVDLKRMSTRLARKRRT